MMKKNKKYYVNGEEITANEARRIEAENVELLASGDFLKMENIKFIVEVTI